MEPKPLPLLIAIIVLLLVGGALWFVLTRNSDVPPPGSLNPSSGQVDTGTKQELHDSGDYYDITGTYPSSAGLSGSVDALAVGYMKTFVEQESARFKDTNISELTAEDIQIQGLGGDRKYVLDIDYDFYSSPRTTSFVYHMYADTLGAHPNGYYRTFTFDRETGDGLALDDLFTPTTDYLSVVSTIVREKLPSIIKSYSGYDADPDMLLAGTSPDADNFQNFYLDGADLVIVFPPYQVGPYALGTQEVHIPRAELGNALRVEYR